MTERLKLSLLTRGALFARAANSHSIRLIGTDPIPVLHDREGVAFDWQARPGPVFTGLSEEGGPDWWMAPEREGWRRALGPGALVWIRRALPDGRDDGAAEHDKGVWQLSQGIVETGRMTLWLARRIGDAR